MAVMTAADYQKIITLLSEADRLITANAQKAIEKDPRKARRLKDLADRLNTIRVEIYDLKDGYLG